MMEYLLRKATGNEWSQCKRKAIWVTNGKAIEVRLSKP
jgi:hypothetical protein